MRYTVSITVLLGFLLVWSPATSVAQPQPDDQPAETMAPGFTLETLDGNSFSLEEQRGKIVVLNFWATWCPPCRAEIPGFVSIQDEYRDRGVLFVGVSLDEEGFEVVRPFAEEYAINYPLVVDDGSVASSYGGVASLPTTFLIDRKGRVRNAAMGMLPEEALRPALDFLLEEGE